MLIESDGNPRFKAWRKLLNSKGLKDSTDCIVPGWQLIQEALKNHTLDIKTIMLPEGYLLDARTQTRLRNTEIITLKKTLFEILDVLGTHAPLALATQPQLESWREDNLPVGLEVLCPLGDPKNLGALIRSAEAFGATAVVLLSEAAHPFSQKSIKASAGAVLRQKIYFGPFLNQLKGPCYTLDAKGEAIENFAWPQNFRLLVGEEGGHLPDHLRAQSLSIKMHGQLESLNATVASSIALYLASRAHP